MIESIRIDKWLWFSRICKSRSFAQKLCSEGCLKINSIIIKKPNKTIKIKDFITITYFNKVTKVKVLSLASTRQPACDAEKMYESSNDIKGFFRKKYYNFNYRN